MFRGIGTSMISLEMLFVRTTTTVVLGSVFASEHCIAGHEASLQHTRHPRYRASGYRGIAYVCFLHENRHIYPWGGAR